MIKAGSGRSSGQLPSWFGIPFLLGGVLMAVFGFVLLQDELRFGNEGVSTSGAVVDTVYHPGGGDTGPSYSIRYTFVDPAGGIRSGETDVSEELFDSALPGDPIEVTYLPANPSKSRVGSPEPQLLIPLIVMGGAALFGIVGVGLLLLTRWLRSNSPPSWVSVGGGSLAFPMSPPEAHAQFGGRGEPLVGVAAAASAAAPPVLAPAVEPSDQQPMSDADLRALDARLAPPSDNT